MSDIERRKEAASAAIDRVADELRALSLEIHRHPELNFEEFHAHEVLTSYLKGKGFAVTAGAYEMPTAFEAVAGNGSPVVAVLCEYDALPEIGHACGHNLIAASGVAAGIALKETLDEGQGTVIVLGSPAEEGGGGKVYLVERGAFDRVDAAMMLHPAPIDSAWANIIAVEQLTVEYFGRNAHASARPWEGVNALDALITAYNAISAMRQQFRPTDRVHGVITKGGVKPNIIPDHTEAEYLIRAKNRSELDELKAKVVPCFEGAGTAAGCRTEIRSVNQPYGDMVSSDALALSYRDNMAQFGVALPSKEESLSGPAGSTDMGNVSYVVPSIHPYFGIPTTTGNHTPGFTDAAATPEAHQAMLLAAKGMAMTALDVYLREDLLEAAKQEFATVVAK